MIREFCVEEGAGSRIDRYLSEQVAEMSRAHLQKLLKDGGVTVNDRPVKSSYKVAEGDKIQLDIPEADCSGGDGS